MQIKFIGTHSLESRDDKLSTYLIDDIIAVDAGSISSELTFQEQRQIKGILLTHGHYDHIRDIPAFALANVDHVTKIFSNKETLQILQSHLLDGTVYPKFSQKESFLKKPVLELITIEPYHTTHFNNYQFKAIPVNHPLDAVGFEITRKNSKTVFFTGDTGPGLDNIWQHIKPDVIICDVTFPNKLKAMAKDAGHLCPELLMNELILFQQLKGYLPEIVATHLSPQHEKVIEKELNLVSGKMKVHITIAHEKNELSI